MGHVSPVTCLALHTLETILVKPAFISKPLAALLPGELDGLKDNRQTDKRTLQLIDWISLGADSLKSNIFNSTKGFSYNKGPKRRILL